MVGLEKDLVVRKEAKPPPDLREIAAKTTLSRVRQQGHPYVELRHEGKRIIFFCTICLTKCYNDNVLFDHLGGSLHARQRAGAAATLLGPVPWPFNDGVLFFGNSHEKDTNIIKDEMPQHKTLIHSAASVGDDEITSKLRDDLSISESTGTDNTLADGPIVCVNDANQQQIVVSGGRVVPWTSSSGIVVIPSVVHKDVVADLGVRLMGLGKIAYRIADDSSGHGEVRKIWCAWAGKDGLEQWAASNMCDFAVVSFSYTDYLGRKWNSEDDCFESPESFFMIDDAGNRGKKTKKSFSDPEVSSDESNGQSDMSTKAGNLVLAGTCDASRDLQVKCTSKRAARRKLRKQMLSAERACDICAQPMLPGKDVAALLNCKTGYLACSSRNTTGAFHLFHASCLIHWILLCEYEILVDQLSKKSRGTRGRKRKANADNHISSILCPECQGTGAEILGDEFEKPKISLSEMFRYKLKAIGAHKEWMKNPEELQECSTGLCFAPKSKTTVVVKEKVVPLKVARIYRAHHYETN